MATKAKPKTETKSRKSTAKKSTAGGSSTRKTANSSSGKKKSLKTTTKSGTSARKKNSGKSRGMTGKEAGIDPKAEVETALTGASVSKHVVAPVDTPFAASHVTHEREIIPRSPALEAITSGIADIDRSDPRVGIPSGALFESGGDVEISRELLSRITIMVINEIDGIEPARTDTVAKILNSVQGRINGIRIAKGNTEVAVDMIVRIRYGANIPELTQRLRETVGRRIWEMTGLRVVETNVTVQDITSIAPV